MHRFRRFSIVSHTLCVLILVSTAIGCGDEELLSGQWEMVRADENSPIPVSAADAYTDYFQIETSEGPQDVLIKMNIGHFGKEFAGVIAFYNKLELQNPYFQGNEYQDCPCAYMQSGYYGNDKGTFIFELCDKTTVEASFEVKDDETLLVHFRRNPGANLSEFRVRFVLTEEFVDNDDKLCGQ